jgi:hypothetical protein
MGFHSDELYQDPTWFDALGAWCLHHCRRCLPRQRAQLWTTGFTLFAALCVTWAAGLATHCVVYELPWNQCAAQLLAAGMLLIAARHFLVATESSARGALPRNKLVTRSREPDKAQPQVVSRTRTRVAPVHGPRSPTPATVQAGADPQLFFRAVKAAGINVRIARALYAAGFRNGEQVRACADAHLLAIPGIGPGTLRKLRVQFGIPQSASTPQSNAA